MPQAALYIRDKGPICYAVPVLHREPPLAGLEAELLSSGLAWSWRSWGDPRWVYTIPDLPTDRAVTPLDAATWSLLAADILAETPIDVTGRHIELFAVAAEAREQSRDAAGLRNALLQFAQEQGPLQMVIVQLGDQANELVFVRHNPTEAVRALLETWTSTAPLRAKPYPYKRLNMANFERLFNISLPGK